MDSESDPAIFVIDLQDANKNQFKKKFFCLLLFNGTFTSFFKDKKSKRSHKTVPYESWFFLPPGSGYVTDPNLGGTKTYGSDGSGSATLTISKSMWMYTKAF